MTRPKWNFLVDVVMFALMGAMIFIGVLMGFFMASGPVADRSMKYVWGLHLHQWGDVHAVLSFAFVAFFVLHIILHWSWITGATRKLLRSSAALALILMLPALIILLTWFLSEKDSPAYLDYGRRAGAESGRIKEPPPEEAIVDEETQPGTAEINEHKSGHGRHGACGRKITGQLTIQDVQRITGVSAVSILKKLNLPANTPLDERLGRLRKRYGFSMHDFRQAVSTLEGE